MMRNLTVALACALFLGALTGSPTSRADEKVSCEVVDDVATITHPSTIHVKTTESGKECHFTTSLVSRSSSNSSMSGDQEEIESLFTFGESNLLGRSVDPQNADQLVSTLAQFLVVPFFESEVNTDALNQIRDPLFSSFELLASCVSNVFENGEFEAKTDETATCGILPAASESVPVPAFDELSVRSTEPVFVLAVRSGDTVFAAFVPVHRFFSFTG